MEKCCKVLRMRACVVSLPDSRDSETAKSITIVRLKKTFRTFNREEFQVWVLIASNISLVELVFCSSIGIPQCEAALSDYVSGLSHTYKPRLTLTLELSHAISAQAAILTRSRITFINVALTLGSYKAMNEENGKKVGSDWQ